MDDLAPGSLRPVLPSDLEIAKTAAVGLTAQDPSGKLIFANHAAAVLSGFASVEEFLSATGPEIIKRFEILAEDGSPLPYDALPGRKALKGLRPEEMILRFRVKGDTEDHWSSVTSNPVLDASGNIAYVVNAFRDVSAQKRAEIDRQNALDQERAFREKAERAEEKMAFLALAGKTLFSSLDYRKTLEKVAQLAVPSIADWCAVDILQGDLLNRLAVAHADPAKVKLANELAKRYPPDPNDDTGAYGVVRSGQSLLIPEITMEMLEASTEDPEQIRLAQELGLLSLMVVPLRSPDEIVGTLTMVSAESGRRFDEADLDFAEELAMRAGTAVSHAMEFARRSSVAKALEKSLLPPELPTVKGLDLATRFLPAGDRNRVGGDFYDIFPIGDYRWGIAIGDVRGKGPEAAAVTGLVRHTIRSEARHDPTPSRVMAGVNEALVEERREQFCALCYATITETDDGWRIEGSLGGLPLPLHVTTKETREIAEPGLLLGVTEEPMCSAFDVVVRRGESVLFFTDGVTETRRDGEVFGEKRVREMLMNSLPATAEELAETVIQVVEEFGGAGRHDDLAMFVISSTK